MEFEGKAPTSQFDIRPELLESPWTEDDGVIREFYFNNEESHAHDMEVPCQAWRSHCARWPCAPHHCPVAPGVGF